MKFLNVLSKNILLELNKKIKEMKKRKRKP